MVQFLHLWIDEVQKLHYYKLRGAIMMGELKKMRTEKKMTQQQVADLVGISLRSYKSYENDEKKQGSLKYKYILEKLSEINPIDEEHGIIDIEYITEKCGNVFKKYVEKSGIVRIVDGTGDLSYYLSKNIKTVQTGNIGMYILLMVIGIVAGLGIFFFGML